MKHHQPHQRQKNKKGSYFDTEVSYSFFYDQRDQTYQPTDGYSTYFFELPVNIDENQTVVNGLEYNIIMNI